VWGFILLLRLKNKNKVFKKSVKYFFALMKAAKIINNISIEKEHDTENYQGKKCFLPQFHKYFLPNLLKKIHFIKKKMKKRM
jgi:hypothetical protein